MNNVGYKLLREYRTLTPESKSAVFEYIRWLRDLETAERLGATPRCEESDVLTRLKKSKGKDFLSCLFWYLGL